MKSYLFNINNNRVIINDERSGIGYCYPRVFIENSKDMSHTNLDLTLGAAFRQTKAQFESWLDGTEITGANMEEVCSDLGINHDILMQVIQEVLV